MLYAISDNFSSTTGICACNEPNGFSASSPKLSISKLGIAPHGSSPPANAVLALETKPNKSCPASINPLSKLAVIEVNLFKYSGKMKIQSVIAAGEDGRKVSCRIQPILEFSEFLNTNAEDLTKFPEEIFANYSSNKKISQKNIIENLHTADIAKTLLKEDGSEYIGYYHIHFHKDNVLYFIFI